MKKMSTKKVIEDSISYKFAFQNATMVNLMYHTSFQTLQMQNIYFQTHLGTHNITKQTQM